MKAIHDYIPSLVKRRDNFKKQLSHRERWGIISQPYDKRTAQLEGKIATLTTIIRELCKIS
jgi:hypothetical protein